MTQLIAVFLLVGASFLLGLSVRRKSDPLYNHDPNKPYTSNELRRMGIQPPDEYEDWLRRFGGGAGRTAYEKFPDNSALH